MKKNIWKKWCAVFVLVVLLCSNVITAFAEEQTVTATSAVLYSGAGAEVFAQPNPTTLVTTVQGNLPIQVTGVTANGYFQVTIDGNIYYMYAKALSTITGTKATTLTSFDAKAALLMDTNTGAVLFAQNPYTRLYPASTTKIMTALLVMDAVAAGQITLEDPVIVSATAIAGMPSDASHIKNKLQAGEVITVRNLMYCMMLESDCYACNVLAEHVAGSVPNFVALMNAKAVALGCVDTNFVNAHGYPNAAHYTNAWSLYLIAQAAMKYPDFVAIVQTPTIILPATNVTGPRSISTTNLLLCAGSYYYPYAQGIKTGTANSSGSCLVSAATKNGHQLISVILGSGRATLCDGTVSKQQFAESIRLFELGFASY